MQAQPSQSNSENLKPPLKWAGGKRWLLPHLAGIWEKHSHRRYVEPFCGGLAVALGLRPKAGLINDANPHVINFYHHLQSGLKLNIEAENSEDCFYRQRERFNGLIRERKQRTAEAAQLFYYLNRTGYNGLCRFNNRGEFNVPFGRHKTINYVRDFNAYRDAIDGWSFTTGDVESLRVKRDDFIYADPPYDVEFTTYSAGGFSWEDQVRTAEWLARHRGPMVLSNQATARIVKLYKQLGFKLEFLEGPRRISCNGNRATAREVLALNASC